MNAGAESPRRFVVATPARSVCDENARALEQAGRLAFLALGTRRGIAGVPPEHTRLNPRIGLAAYALARTLPTAPAESLRMRLHPWFDRWVRSQLQPGQHLISSYGYVNGSFRWIRRNGGRTFLDGGNSHPANFWEIISEEHRRWQCARPPLPPHHYQRALAMLEETDFVLTPSSYVTRSFLERGFRPEQMIRNVYPVNLSLFKPAGAPRPQNRPLTFINTGSLSLRKGTPYLLEAFRIIHRQHPSARFLLTSLIEPSVAPVLARYQDLPIDWAPGLPHEPLAARLREADVFVLPSLEDGFARTVTEALACGLPVVLTPNTGACDLIQPGVNGAIVPIRDATVLAEAMLECAEKLVLHRAAPPVCLVDSTQLSFEHFARTFLEQLDARSLLA